MRIVADTNTVLSGLLWPGPPRRLLELARQRAFTLCTSPILLAELAEAIAAMLSAIRQLMNPPQPKRRPIGFTANIDEKS